jgi:hypothetical protein
MKKNNMFLSIGFNYLIYTSVVFITAFCATSQNSFKSTTIVNVIDDLSYWKRTSPVAFIDTLKLHPGEIFAIQIEPDINWYEEVQIPFLEDKLGDKSLCAAVVSAYISERPLYKKTTISDQAKFLIKGIKEKKYPPTLSYSK